MSAQRGKFSILDDWPEVDIDPQGIFKYVLIEAYAEENEEVITKRMTSLGSLFMHCLLYYTKILKGAK